MANVSSLVRQNNPFWCGKWTCHVWQVESVSCGRWTCQLQEVGDCHVAGGTCQADLPCGKSAWQVDLPCGKSAWQVDLPHIPHLNLRHPQTPNRLPHPNLPDLPHLNLHPRHASTKPQPGTPAAPQSGIYLNPTCPPPFPRNDFSK